MVKRGGTADAFRPQQLLLGTEGFFISNQKPALESAW